MDGGLAARLKKASHAGIIRIGFEGISQPRNAAEHPCFNSSIETLRGGELQMRRVGRALVSDRVNSRPWSSCDPTLSPKKRAKGWGTVRFLFERSEI